MSDEIVIIKGVNWNVNFADKAVNNIERVEKERDQLKKDALELARYVENNAHDEKHCIEAALGFKAKYGEK